TGIALNMGAERAAKFTVELLTRSAVYVDGALYDASQGWPTRAQDAADWYVEANIPEGESASDWKLAQSTERGYVILQRNDDVLIGETSRKKIPISEVSEAWR